MVWLKFITWVYATKVKKTTFGKILKFHQASLGFGKKDLSYSTDNISETCFFKQTADDLTLSSSFLLLLQELSKILKKDLRSDQSKS